MKGLEKFKADSDSGYNIAAAVKKSLLIIIAVALLGLAGYYASSRSQPPAVGAVAGSTDSAGAPAPSGVPVSSGYQDGTFTGSNENTPYGDVQIAVVIKGGKIADVQFLRMPDDLGRSSDLTVYSEPLLKQTTLKSQSGHVDFVSGATSTSLGYEQSLQAALDQAGSRS